MTQHVRTLTIRHEPVDFASNDYLGLAKSKELAQRVMQECSTLGLGSGGSRLLTGNSAYAEALEAKIAAFHGFEAGTLFNCGYMANSGLIPAVTGKDDLILYDISVHASMHEGIAHTKARALPFRKNDMKHLEKRLKTPCKGKLFICVSSVCSTDGTLTPLICGNYRAHLIVDEAHAVGVLGAQGKGLFNRDVFAKVVTFGKALGVHGAIVLGSHELKHTLVNQCKTFIYTTALPFYCLAAIKCTYDLFPKFEAERQHLRELMRLVGRQSTICPLPYQGQELPPGFDVRPLFSPTVKRGKEVWRICLHSYNTKEELKKLWTTLS